jgi:hypothetical protein
MERGFSGYYANWFGESFPEIIAHLFAGRTTGDAYKSTSEFNGDSVNYDKHPAANDRDMWVAHTSWGNGTVYHNAFVGISNKTLPELFSQKQTPIKDAKLDRLLIDAIYNGDDADAFKQLDAGANPDAVYNGWPALHLAVYFDRQKVVAELLKRKADPQIEVQGYSALTLAETYKRTEIIRMLEEAGATKSRAMPGNRPGVPKRK